MNTYNIDIHFEDMTFTGTISCDADWQCSSDTIEWSGPYRRVEITTELNEIQDIKIVDLEISTPDYDYYVPEGHGLLTRVWEHFLNQNIDNGLFGILEDNICDNHDILEEQSE